MWLVEFGQSHESFQDVWLDEWLAAYDAWIEKQSREYVIGGTIASAVLNANRGKKGKPLGPADVFPHLKKNQRRTEMPEEEIRKRLMIAFGYPGAAKRKP